MGCLSYLKRGIATMPLPTRKTFAQYSHLSNWHRPFELLPYPSQSYADPLSWILKGSMSTSSLNYKTTQYLWNTYVDSRANLRWTLGPDGLLRHSRCIYVPDSSLRLCVLQYSHDHPLAGHYGQSKTLYQVCLNYYWPGLPTY